MTPASSAPASEAGAATLRTYDASVLAPYRDRGISRNRDAVILLGEIGQGGVAVARVLDVDEHRAPVRRHGDTRNLTTRNAFEETLQLAACGVRDQHLVVDVIGLPPAVRLNEQTAVGIGPEPVRRPKGRFRSRGLRGDQKHVPLETRADVMVAVSPAENAPFTVAVRQRAIHVLVRSDRRPLRTLQRRRADDIGGAACEDQNL